MEVRGVESILRRNEITDICGNGCIDEVAGKVDISASEAANNSIRIGEMVLEIRFCEVYLNVRQLRLMVMYVS